VTHVGSHRGHGEDEGIKRVAEAVGRTLEGRAASVMILLENTAGSGQGLGYQFEQLARIRDGVTAKERVGICLDTAHLFASGYPIHTPDGLEEVLAGFDRILGRAVLKLIHLNDSKAPFNSRVDRHWHIGEGAIGLKAMGRLVRHPQLAGVPLILETPKKGEEEDHRNLATVRKLMRARPKTRLAAGRRRAAR
jgi:deoxyribonuclease-4